MTTRLSRTALCAALALLSLVRYAGATSTYYDKPNEYVTIKHGRSPNGAWFIAAHGAGEDGDPDEFRIYFMDGKTGKKIGPLTEITETSYQDTAAGAYHAAWSADSQLVTISYRSDRHHLHGQIQDRRASCDQGARPKARHRQGSRGTRLA